MADGSRESRTDHKNPNEITFSANNSGVDNIKTTGEEPVNRERLKLSFYVERTLSENGDKCGSNGVVTEIPTVSSSMNLADGNYSAADDDRKKRCVDRYDSSESSDSGVAVLSPTESSGCSSSDITEPGSPRSPESSSGVSEEGASTRMPPWACESAPSPGPRRAAATTAAPPPATRRPTPPPHRRITEFFSHKMKAHNGLKRDCNTTANISDPKKKCLPNKNAAQDLEKYISYLSQTLSPRVLFDVGKQQTTEAVPKTDQTNSKGLLDHNNTADLKRGQSNTTSGLLDLPKIKDSKTPIYDFLNLNKPLLDDPPPYFAPTNRKKASPKKKAVNKSVNTSINKNKLLLDPSANGILNSKVNLDNSKKLPTPSGQEFVGLKIPKVDTRLNGLSCPSGITVNHIAPKMAPVAEQQSKPPSQPSKRNKRKSSACIANSKNLTWSKANNLKQVELAKLNCSNPVTTTANISGDAPSASINKVPNGVHQVPINGSISSLNMPVNNIHPINLHQRPCNGTVPQTNLTSFVTVPPNVMLTTLRIPQNGLPPQHNNMTFAQQNVASPTKLNGQFMFPLMQNINGAVVQIPNLMTKVPNFVLPQTTHRPDQLQNQQFLINGTLLKLSNTMPNPYNNMNKAIPTSQPINTMNKNISGIGIPVQPKPNYTMNLSHPMLVPQPGFIVTSVPNMNVKETWSRVGVHPSTSPLAGGVPPPRAPGEPPDPPAAAAPDPPPSTTNTNKPKCDMPWLTKTLNNNHVHLDSNKFTRPFTELCCESEKLPESSEIVKLDDKRADDKVTSEAQFDKTTEEIRRLEEVARREETLFTQITVLKDVSSNVQNSVIDSTYVNNGTPESSESGIGTDKSIASPSDSQTSKECDEDSSVSLSVSVCSVETGSGQKSPLLKEPTTLRFPPREKGKGARRHTSNGLALCLWHSCNSEFDNDSDLLEHLQVAHVESQAGQEHYTCEWKSCKVRGKPSCSRLWLERHAAAHAGNKPFKCIVDGCGRRFSTQNLLERHVNHHFSEAAVSTAGGRKSTDSAPKLIRRNGKKLRYRRQPWSARMFDMFDAGAMEGVAWRLSRSARWRSAGACPLRDPRPTALTLRATVAAVRQHPQHHHQRQALLVYSPPHVLEDEWVPIDEVVSVKHVEIASLPAPAKVALYEQFCASYAAEPAAQMPASEPARPASPPPSGARKRKLGRRHGGNAFWPCGR